jgi:hypothetical protein
MPGHAGAGFSDYSLGTARLCLGSRSVRFGNPVRLLLAEPFPVYSVAMLIFAVTSNAENPELGAHINRVYPSANLKFAPNVWFVADTGVTTQEVSEKLSVWPGGIAGVVVVKVESYFGYAPTSIWEWFSVKMGGA